MTDIVEYINGSLVQHGTLNRRIYLMHLATDAIAELIAALENIAAQNSYGKIIAKIPAPAWPEFKTHGFLKEAVIPGFFNGRIDGYFIAKYYSLERQIDLRVQRSIIDFATDDHRPLNGRSQNIGRDEPVVVCRTSDVEEMSILYRDVFESYPFPICKPAYLKQCMDHGVRYFGIRKNDRLVAVASAEIDLRAQNAEMTDFATRAQWRGRGLAGVLLRHTENAAAQKGIKTTYTIARARSEGMNRVFTRQKYRYAGWLPNNTHIGGRIDSMIVWYKRLKNV